MTSTNDGKDVKSNQTSGHKGKSYYIDLYKSLEKHLSEECELRERTQHLCEAWRRVHSLCQHSAPTTHPHYLAWLQRHTAHTLLQSEWQSEKDEHTKLEDAINSFIEECKAAAAIRNGHSPSWESQLLQRGEWFKSILGNPWGHPVLKVLCDPRGKPPTDEEILEWLKDERGVMFVTRLRHLAASRKCHEIALALATAVMDRTRACETLVPDAEQVEDQETSRPEGSPPTFKDVLRSEAGFTIDVWELVTDLELVLLHKRDGHAQCIALAKKIPLRSGYQLVERLRSRPETSPREKKLWKNAGEVATLVAQVLITRCMVVPTCGGVVRSALYCCARSLVRLLPAARLPAAAVALAAPAATAKHLHTLAAAVHTQLHAQHAQDMNSFVCELYVRAITAGMNELEKLKIKTEKESEARVMEQTLASWFTSLGSLLSASARIQCECALTAFSVHPSPAMYDKIKAAPPLPKIHVENQEPKEETKSEFGSWANDSRGQTNLVKTSETLKLKQTQQHTNVMSTAIFAEGEAIGLSAELCQDLTVCLSGPRVKTMSWDMDREVLLDNCQKYMARTHGGTRALTTELKYLNLDPREYQHLPEEDDDENDVYYGIEKGYEHLVELQEEASWEDPFLDTETAYSSCMEDEVPQRRKKKTKRLPVSSEDDSDPLSTLAEKTDRSYSKDRSKERKKTKNPDADKEKTDSKEKKKRERKKKPKEQPISKPGSLASLIGVKIVRAEEIAVTDSDYDSQGKSSLASEGNDTNVIFDGHYTMDHKSPDKIDPLSDKPPLNNKLDTNRVPAVNKPKRKPSVNKRKPKINTNVPTDGKPPVQTIRTISVMKPESRPRPSAVGAVSDHVKRSITKLLQFRRNQNAGLAHRNAPRSDSKPTNAIYKPDFPVQSFVSPKSVVVPEIPKSYINKATLEKLNIGRTTPASNYSKTNEFMGPPSQSRFENNSHKSANEVVRPSSTTSAANMDNPLNYKDVISIQSYYQNANLNHQPQASRSIANDSSKVQPKNISMSLTRVPTSRAHVSEHEKSYEKFLRELKMSINAGTGSNPSPSLSAPIGVVAKKDNPTIRTTLGMPCASTADVTPQCAKQITQKKVENAPNTFSRLSYMHKNKQSDMKQKQALETQAQPQHEWDKQATASLELSRSITEFKNTKIKYIQTKGETVITRVDNPLNLSCDNIVRKTDKSPSTSRNYPDMSSILQSTSIPQSPTSRNNTVTSPKVPSPPGTSYLSEKDQNDLVLLLQQRNRINAVRTVPRVANPQNVPINMTTTSNKPASNNVMSTSTPGPTLLNTHLRQAQPNKTGPCEAKPTTVINFSDIVTQKRERAKKAATAKPKPSARKERTKSTHLESETLDWESVMNAIRAQKTPSRGPSALELALNKDSADNSLRKQRIVRTNSVGQLDKVEATIDAVIKHTNSVKPSPSLDMPILTSTGNAEVKTQYNLQIDTKTKPVEIKKAVKNVTPKRVSVSVDKKQIIKNKFSVSVSNSKDVDPFIHGRDDDYNLSDLDDLLDDELRRELGELSSDEDAYRIPQAQKGVKITYSKINTISKQGVKEKTVETKYVPNAIVSSSDQLRTTQATTVLNCQYPKSRETSTVCSQAIKKQKAPVQTCLLNQSINKAACIDNVNKNIVRKEKPQQVSDVISRQSTPSHTVINKQTNKQKVANSTLHYKYLNTVHSNASVDKNSLNKGAEKQSPGPSYLNTVHSNASVDKNMLNKGAEKQTPGPSYLNTVHSNASVDKNSVNKGAENRTTGPSYQNTVNSNASVDKNLLNKGAENQTLGPSYLNTVHSNASVDKNSLNKGAENRTTGPSYQNTVHSNVSVDKNSLNKGAENQTLGPSYFNTVHSNASVDKNSLNKGAENQTPGPSLHNQYIGTPNTNVNNNVYVVENEPVIQLSVPAANVVLFGSEMYYNPNIQTQIGPSLCTMNQTYIQQTAPNITLYQTANFAPVVQQASFVAPIVTPLVLDNTVNVPVTVSTPVTTQETTPTENTQPYFTDPAPTRCEDEPVMVNSNQPIVIKESPMPRRIDQPLIDTTTKMQNKATFDNNLNKHSEKVSLEVQESQKHEASKLNRNRSVSTEEIFRDIIKDQEKEPTIKNNVIINPVVKNLLKDRIESYSMKDIERLKRKRLSILNRKIFHDSVHPPIALNYSPIFQSRINIGKIPEKPIDTNKEVVSQEIIPILEDNESNVVEKKMADVIDLISQVKNDAPSLTTDDAVKQPNDEHSKENTSSTPQCRRILLRSSNKNLLKIPTSDNDQNSVGRKTKVRLKVVREKPITEANKMVEVSDKNVKPHNGMLTVKTIAKRNVKRKVAATKNKKQSSTSVCVTAASVSVAPVPVDSAESIVDDLCKNVAEPLISENFDIEEALLGAKSPNTAVADPLSITLNSPTIKVNEESNVNTKKLNKMTILEDKKITVRRKRKSTKIVDVNVASKNDDNKIEVGEKILPTDSGSVPAENNCLNKIIITKKRQSSRKNSLLRNNVTNPEKPKDITVNVTDKLISSIISPNDEMKVKVNAINFVPKHKEIMNVINEVSKKDKPIQPVENTANKTFQNMFETAVVSDNLQKPAQIPNISKTIADLIEQINKGQILEDHKANNKKESVQSPITIAGNKTMDAENKTASTLVPMKDVVKTNISKNDEEKTILMQDKNSIPQSYKDSIIIEEIPNDKTADNVSKLLRVKLPNGKVYKASVYGKMHTSFDALFDDPSLRAMLMSNFNEQKKYTLNIKQISTPNRENPEKPIDTRIQEIQVKSSSVKPAVVETINLLSDDEESDENCAFKTECGIYKTSLKDKAVIAKHQAKLDQGCSVKLERLVIPEKDVTPNDKLQTSDVIEIDEDSDNDNLEESLPPVFPDIRDKLVEQTDADVIEIDESSNDSVDLLKSCPNLPVALIPDVSIRPDGNEVKCETNSTAEVTNKEKYVDDDVQGENYEKIQSDVHTDRLTTLIGNESRKGSLDCFVPLFKCDDLVEKYKHLEETECVVPTEELETSLDTSDAEMSSNASISILNDFALHSDKNHEEPSEDDRSSPVIGIFEVIASLRKRCEADNTTMADVNCQSEWLLTKRQVSNEFKSINTQMSYSNKSKIELYCDDGRSSPVIGIFEVIASLRNKVAEQETTKSISRYDCWCQCEWMSTKRQMHQNYIDMKDIVTFTKNKLTKHLLDNVFLEKKPVSSHSAPSLVSIMSVFFHNNSSILDHLKPLMKNDNNQRIKRRKSSISNLKRKMQILPDSRIANKMSKNDPLEIDYERITFIEVVDNCDDSEDTNTLRVLDNNENEESGIQNDLKCEVSRLLESNDTKNVCNLNEVSSALIMRDITMEKGHQNEDNNISRDNTEYINPILKNSENPLAASRIDCEESHKNINLVSLKLLNTVNSSNDAKFLASDSSKQLEEKMSTEEVVAETSQDPIKKTFHMKYVNNSIYNTNSTPKERSIEQIVEVNSITLSSQDQLVSDITNTKDIEKNNSKAVTHSSNSVQLLSEQNMITEEKEGHSYENIHDITIVDEDSQSEDKNDMKNLQNDHGRVKDDEPLVVDKQDFIEVDIFSNKDQQVGFVSSDQVQNDDNIISSNSNEKLKDKIKPDECINGPAVLDADLDVDEADKNILKADTSNQNKQRNEPKNDFENSGTFTGSEHNIESQVEDNLMKEAIEETVKLSNHNYEQINTIACKHNDFSHNHELKVEEKSEENVMKVTDKLDNVVEKHYAAEAVMSSQNNQMDDINIVTSDARNENCISQPGCESAMSQDKIEMKQTDNMTNQHCDKIMDIGRIQNDNHCDESAIKSRSEHLQCSAENDEAKRVVETTTKSQKIDVIEGTGHLEDRRQEENITKVVDRNSCLISCEELLETCEKCNELPILNKETESEDDDATVTIIEVADQCTQSDQTSTGLKSLQSQCVISNDSSDETAIDMAEGRSKNAEHDETTSKVETTTEDSQISKKAGTEHLVNMHRKSENVIDLDERSSSATSCKDLLHSGEQFDEIKIVDKNSESDDDDDATVTIIEVADQTSFKKLDMQVEVIVESEEQESLLLDTNVEHIQVDTANKNIELGDCDSTTDSRSEEISPDSSTEPKIETRCLKKFIEFPVKECICHKGEEDPTCEELVIRHQRIDGRQHMVPDHEYTHRRQISDKVTTEANTLYDCEIDDTDVNEILADTNTIVRENDSRDCLLRGIEYQDPEIGTLYVLYPVEDYGSDSATLNDSCGTPETIEEIEEEVANSSTGNDAADHETLQVNVPKVTYSKQLEDDLQFKKNLKRKINSDSKFSSKKYRKGKNIDYPKITAAAISEQGYSKEYKRVLDYSSSLKFSYTQPFHKDYLDVDETIKDWPIKGPCSAQPELATESEINIFTGTETNPNYKAIPMEQTLEEEINQDYSEISEPSSDINETNFNMGFGEGSGRVIQNLEDVGDISKVSAATLSDVKQPQPFLLSAHCEEEGSKENAVKDQSEKIQRYLTFIELRQKVKAFFQKSSIELKCDSLDQKKKELLSCENLDSATFPFDFYIGNFKEPPPIEPIVQVVQVGQLPVSAAAQNPVTCDPRVTQVSDASPSQCSVDNSPQDDSSTPIKTEYTELTTADLTLPLVQEYAQHNQTLPMESHENPNVPMSGENIPIETEIKSVIKIELEELEEKDESADLPENTDSESMAVNHSNDYSYETNNLTTAPELNMPEIKYESEEPPQTPYAENNRHAPLEQENMQMIFNSTEENTKESPPEEFSHQKQNGAPGKTDQIAHAMSAAGITTTAETIANNRAQALVNIINQKIRQGSAGGNTQATANSYPKTTSINAMALQQALAQILPPPLNQTNATDNNQQTSNTPQVLHIVQGKNASGSQITLVDNSQQSVISGTNATPVLHIVQNKSGTAGVTANGAPGSQNNSFTGLSLVDAGLQQGGNQLLHIVNTGSQKNNNAGQLLKRVNLLTNLTNVQGSNEQKMVQFVCKSADGKSIQLNAPHQRSMVLRLQPIESPAQAKPAENQEPNQPSSAANNKDAAAQQEIKSRSVYEENYAKFIQNSGTKPPPAAEKSTSLPKFNQAFVGKPVFQDGTQKSNEMNSNSMPSVNTPNENNECPPNENTINIEHIGQISSPPLLLRKQSAQTSQAQTNIVQQIKQTIAPMNIQTMHGGVIYTRQIPVNIGGGQTINLITVPSTELIDESGQKQQSTNQGEIEPSIIKIVPQSQPTNNSEMSEDGNANMAASNENNQNPQPQPQPVLTQMRIKLPMLSKTPQMVGGARVVRPSFFQIQRNVIGGNNQPVYQQLVLTAAPPLGQQTIRLPAANRTQIKVPTESQSSTESMSSSTLEQLREFDMVLEQVKERSTVQPNSGNTTTFPKLHTPSSDTTDNAVSAPATPTEQTQVLYSIGNNQQLNVAYVNRKATVTTPTTSNFVRSPDSSSVADSPTSSTHVRMSHTPASENTSNEVALNQPKPAKVGSKSKSRPKSSSHSHNPLTKINPVPAKTSTQKPLEDEQTTQRILYILAEYKEQVENSPDKDKPAPRRRSNPPSNPGSSKRKKSSSGSRRICGRDMSPVHGDETSRTMGSEDSSCGTSQGDCNENCLDSHSPQDSPRKIVRKLTYEPENAVQQQPRPQPQRNVIVADGQTITVARGTAGKPATAVLMPANYILPVSMVKGGQQIAIVTNRGPKLLTVGGGEGGATNALLLQRLIGPGGLKPVLARPGVRHVRLPTAALHNLQAFNLATATTVQPPDSTASPAPAPTPPELVETRATSSPWTNRESEDVKPERGSSPEGSEPWNLPSSADPHDYTYEETVRADNMDRTVLDPIPDRYSPDMEAQRIFDKMFDVDSKKSYIVDSPRCGYDIDASDCDNKAYQVVHKKDGISQRHHRLTHVSAAALRHKYAILEHELRLQKSLSEECEDLGVDSPSASELFPEAELLFAASPAHDHTQEQAQQSHTPQPTILNQSSIPQPDIDDQIATDQLLPREDMDRQQLELGLEDVGIVSVGAGLQAVALDHEEFARAHPNTTFHTDEPTDDEPVPPFAIAGLKGRHITSTIFHSNRAPATVLMTAPQTTVISQASAEPAQNVKYSDIDNMINSLPSSHNNINLSSVLVKDDGLTRFDNILNDSRELHLTNTASAIVHSTGNATQVIRRVCYDDKRDRDTSFLMDEPDAIIAGDDAKMIAEDSSRDATLESMADVDDDRSSPERHAELFWESNSASERSESRRPLDFSSDSDKCCKSPSYDETNSTDSSGVGTHMRLDSVIKEARGIERSGSADGSSADDTHPPLRTYPPKRLYHPLDGDMERSLSGKTRAGERSPDSLEVRRRASGRGVVKRGCHCCNGSPAPPRPKKSRQRKPTMDFTTN